MLQYELPPVQPVMQVDEHEESPFHDHMYRANFVAKYPSHLSEPVGDGLLDSLANLLAALKDVEGGMFGQEACDRGMDAATIRALAAFARTFRDSDNQQASEISKSFIEQDLAAYEAPKYIEIDLGGKKRQPEPPSLG